MRRIVTAALATVSSLVLLFSYPTSHNQAVAVDGDGGSGDTASAAAPTATGGDGGDDGTASANGDEDGDDRAASSAGSSSGSSAAGSAGSSGSSAGSSSKGSAKSGSAKTYTGNEVQTRWGVVQVAITVQNGKITAANAVKHPDENSRDAQINGYALPILNAEVVKAQSASIDSVSGATVTSNGYLQSLQSALDAAHL